MGISVQDNVNEENFSAGYTNFIRIGISPVKGWGGYKTLFFLLLNS